MKKYIVMGIALLFAGCAQSGPESNVPLERQREYATALYDQQLYKQAITEYEKILDHYSIDNKVSANINYLIGNIYFEKFGDYQNSLNYYLRIKHLYKESDLADEANRKAVASLERMGRSISAASLSKSSASSTGDDFEFNHLPGDTVAVIGPTYLSSGDLDRMFNYYLSGLAPGSGIKNDRNTKIQFLSEYIKREVLYNSAKTQQYDNDSEVMEIVFAQKKMVMIDKLLNEKIYKSLNVTEPEMKRFYDENKSKLSERTADGKSKSLTYEEAKETVRQFILSQKGVKAKADLTDELISSQGAKAFILKIK